MIEKIRVKNYKSILDTTLALDYSRRRPRNYSSLDTLYYVEDNGRRAVPFVVIYGANSSGKSTLLEALEAVIEIVKGGKCSDCYHPNIFLSKDEETHVNLVITKDGSTYDYTLIYKGEKIVRESLIRDGGVIFDESVSTVSVLKNKDARFFSLLTGSFIFYDPFSYSAEKSFSTYLGLSGKTESECIEDIITLSHRLDLSFSGIRRGEEWNTIYRDGDTLRFRDESEGTRRLVAIISLALASLSSGGVMVADEIDVSLHPAVLRSIFALFIDKEYNRNGAQLISSAHNTDIMDAPFVREDEIALFEKTRRGGSVIERIFEKTGGKRVKDIRKGYLEGRYSGLPFPYI